MCWKEVVHRIEINYMRITQLPSQFLTYVICVTYM